MIDYSFTTSGLSHKTGLWRQTGNVVQPAGGFRRCSHLNLAVPAFSHQVILSLKIFCLKILLEFNFFFFFTIKSEFHIYCTCQNTLHVYCALEHAHGPHCFQHTEDPFSAFFIRKESGEYRNFLSHTSLFAPCLISYTAWKMSHTQQQQHKTSPAGCFWFCAILSCPPVVTETTCYLRKPTLRAR